MTEPTSPAPVSTKKKTFSIFSALAVLAVIFFFLAAIATPKFLKFSCKSAQSEAKTNLSGIFTAEKAFFGEYGFYTTDLVSLNWAPDGSPHYVYGFAVASEKSSDPKVPDLDPTRRTTIDPRVQEGDRFRADKMKASSGRVYSDADFDAANVLAAAERESATATATETSFTAVAIGDTDRDKTLDLWSINEMRTLQVLTNDCSD